MSFKHIVAIRLNNNKSKRELTNQTRVCKEAVCVVLL